MYAQLFDARGTRYERNAINPESWLYRQWRMHNVYSISLALHVRDSAEMVVRNKSQWTLRWRFDTHAYALSRLQKYMRESAPARGNARITIFDYTENQRYTVPFYGAFDSIVKDCGGTCEHNSGYHGIDPDDRNTEAIHQMYAETCTYCHKAIYFFAHIAASDDPTRWITFSAVKYEDPYITPQAQAQA